MEAASPPSLDVAVAKLPELEKSQSVRDDSGTDDLNGGEVLPMRRLTVVLGCVIGSFHSCAVVMPDILQGFRARISHYCCRPDDSSDSLTDGGVALQRCGRFLVASKRLLSAACMCLHFENHSRFRLIMLTYIGRIYAVFRSSIKHHAAEDRVSHIDRDI